MPPNVLANGRPVACKAASGKSICPPTNVGFCPPNAPPTPPGVPAPLPSIAFASDTSDGTRTVKIASKEVGIKNQSCFKKSTGDEAAATPKKGLVTGTRGGKVYFASWSMDVKFEGANAVRHLDMTTHNHASANGNAFVTVYGDPPPIDLRCEIASEESECKDDVKRAKHACRGDDAKRCPSVRGDLSVAGELSNKSLQDLKSRAPQVHKSQKRAKQRKESVALVDKLIEDRNRQLTLHELRLLRDLAKGTTKTKDNPYRSTHEKLNNAINDLHSFLADEINNNACHAALRCMLAQYDSGACCPGQTPHHLLQASAFKNCTRYEHHNAPCICLEGASQTQGSHGMMHTYQGVIALEYKERKLTWTREKATEVAAQAVACLFGCKPECIRSQLDDYHDSICPTPDGNPTTAAEPNPEAGSAWSPNAVEAPKRGNPSAPGPKCPDPKRRKCRPKVPPRCTPGCKGIDNEFKLESTLTRNEQERENALSEMLKHLGDNSNLPEEDLAELKQPRS